MRFVLILCLLISSFVTADSLTELTAQAQQQNPNAQYQLALSYQQGNGVVKNLDNAFYWYQQAAHNDHPLAKLKLADAYLKGLGTTQSTSQAIFWLTDLATTGNIDAQLRLAQLYETLPSSPSPLELSEIWYHAAAAENTQAEEGYARVLEEKFNKQRAKQISSIEQLNSAFTTTSEEEASISSASTTKPQADIMADYLSLIVLAIICLVTWYIYRFLIKRHRENKNQANNKLQKDNQSQAFVIKQQKRQLETLFRELKRLQQLHANQSQDQKLLLACTLFGFKPSALPDEKAIKLRYKQLSKIYHPDLKGSQDEMKRLNAALKIILCSVNKK